MHGHPLSSSINFGIFCEITSLKLNVMQIRSLKRRTQRWAGLRFLRDNAAISPRNESSAENYLQCHFLCMITQIFLSQRFLQKKKNVSVYLHHVVELLHQRRRCQQCKQKKKKKKKLITGQNYLDCLSLLASRDIIAPKNRERYLPGTHLFIR